VRNAVAPRRRRMNGVGVAATDAVTCTVRTPQMAVNPHGDGHDRERHCHYHVAARKNLRRPAERRNINSANGTPSTSHDVPVTAATRRALERELASLRIEQHEIPARLRVAREFGDTANNDEHLAIREEEAVPAARIVQLEGILMRAIEVDDAGDPGSVTIGSVVAAVDVETGKTLEYVVGSAHGVLSRGTVSALSPIGRALLGRRVGDRVSVHLPRGRRRELKLREVLQPQ
jgi:transcription elongation factor GreA